MTGTSLGAPTASPSRTVLLAVIGVGYALVMTAVGNTWWAAGSTHTVRDYLVTTAIVLVGAAVVFGLVVRGVEGRDDAGRGARTRAVVLGLLALVAVVVFWSGLPFVLAAGAGACLVALVQRGERLGTSGVVALVITGVALLMSTVATFAG